MGGFVHRLEAAEDNTQVQMQDFAAENELLRTALSISRDEAQARELALLELERHAAACLVDVQRRASAAEARALAATQDAHAARAYAAIAEEDTRRSAQAAWAYAAWAIAKAQAFYAEQVTELQSRASTIISSIDLLAHQAIETTKSEASERVADMERKAAEAEDMAQDVEERLLFALEETENYLDQAHQLITGRSEYEVQLTADLQKQLAEAVSQSDTLRERVTTLRNENKALRQKVSRFPEQKTRAQENAAKAVAADFTSVHATLHLKEKGVVPEPVRVLVRDLVELGLKVNQVNGAIALVARATGNAVAGRLSERSIGRFVREGGVAAAMQIVDEIQTAQSDLASN